MRISDWSSDVCSADLFAGADVWRDGIRHYIKNYAYHNTVTDHLWAAVEASRAKGITQIAHDFTLQPGIPLIRVESALCKNGRTELSLTDRKSTRLNSSH